ncbi:MAG: PilN domain-containing protein [Acidobacteriota bacterium]
MLRTNLATRPFYNERVAHVLIGAAALLVLAITIVNAVRIVGLSRHNTELSSRTAVEHAEAERLTAEAARVRKTIDSDELERVVGAAQEANSLIDQRTFSWTEFFNQIESTLPPDVMLTAVRPSIKSGVTEVAILVLAKRFEDVEDFNDKLEATGSFDQVNVSSSDRTESGLFRAVIQSVYTGAGPDSAGAAPAEAPHAAGAAMPGSAPGRAGSKSVPGPSTTEPPRAPAGAPVPGGRR